MTHEREQKMILVTGATGKVGGAVLERLAAAGYPVRALARDPSKVKVRGENVEIVAGDLSKPETLDAAFAGIQKVFLVCAGGDMKAIAENAVNAAKKAGAAQIVMLSSALVSGGPETMIGRWHIDAEAKIKASGIAWTMVRPGSFASNTLGWARSIKAQGAVFQPTGEGKIAPIDSRDIADVAVKALTEPGHEGKEYVLSGPELLSGAEMVAKISAAIGRPLKFIAVTEAEAREGMEKAGMPEIVVRAMLEAAALVKAGHGDRRTSTVEELLGRKGRTFDDWLANNLTAFQ